MAIVLGSALALSALALFRDDARYAFFASAALSIVASAAAVLSVGRARQRESTVLDARVGLLRLETFVAFMRQRVGWVAHEAMRPAIESSELGALRSQLDAAQKEAESNLREVAAALSEDEFKRFAHALVELRYLASILDVAIRDKNDR